MKNAEYIERWRAVNVRKEPRDDPPEAPSVMLRMKTRGCGKIPRSA